MDVAEWLRGLGLEHYAPAFRDNGIDGRGADTSRAAYYQRDLAYQRRERL
jgi:hypothetical protein